MQVTCRKGELMWQNEQSKVPITAASVDREARVGLGTGRDRGSTCPVEQKSHWFRARPLVQPSLSVKPSSDSPQRAKVPFLSVPRWSPYLSGQTRGFEHSRPLPRAFLLRPITSVMDILLLDLTVMVNSDSILDQRCPKIPLSSRSI